MRAGQGRAIIAVATMISLAACGDKGDPQLMNLRSGPGPDEFAIVPPKPLEMPKNLADLPEPTPGGPNRTDRDPEAEAVVALGGRPSAAGGIPAADSALYAHAARFGVDGGIRATLASEDLQWRRDNSGRILERLFNVNVYYKAYRKQRLDQQAELARWRALGVRNPSAPPRKKGEE
ncbi:DUF3035 domain-containing protein [Rhodobacter calidifons]|uniref:DUF3035 domain-containing protein n=1 Tax=Rhodobacter calidifons TaxID=2715277 RepID=A0ABX0G3I1_9RHOB|nr:DUF3035 domain-containing protein [Rhodobacter calidifons]NHB75744.1 DUF3035 domain-containing protein [Rhodobacter calidifons]